MAEIDLAQAREFATASELKVIEAATEPSLAKMSGSDLKKHVAQARKLRDKWNDLATRQRREAQKSQGSRATDDAGRSRAKADLFGEVLTRFETRLEQTAGSQDASAAPKKKRVTKKHRVAAHQEERAAVRKALSETAEDINRARASRKSAAAGSAKKKAAKKAAAKKPATVKKAAAKKAATAKKKSTKKPVSAPDATGKAPGKKAPTKKRPPKFAPSGGISGRQPGAKASAKQTRVDVSGLTNRTRGHVSARTKRDQGRRDAKG